MPAWSGACISHTATQIYSRNVIYPGQGWIEGLRLWKSNFRVLWRPKVNALISLFSPVTRRSHEKSLTSWEEGWIRPFGRRRQDFSFLLTGHIPRTINRTSSTQYG